MQTGNFRFIGYTFKLWAIVVFTSPILYTIGISLLNQERFKYADGGFETFLLMEIFGGLFSIPGLVIFLAINFFLDKIEEQGIRKTITFLLIAAAIFTCSQVFLFHGVFGNSSEQVIMWPYYFTALVAVVTINNKPRAKRFDEQILDSNL